MKTFLNAKIPIFISVVIATLLLVNNVSAEIIPYGRRITWQGNVGVEGGIPTRTNIKNCKTDMGTNNAHGDGVSDDSAHIQACINSLTSGQVAYLPAGRYVLTAGVAISSNKTLRGAGIDSTILLADDISYAVMIGQEWAALPAINIVSGYTKGSNQLVLDNASSINVNSYLRVDELNDPTVPVTNVGYGTCTWCGRDNGARVRGQLVKVIAKNGNTLTISPPMYFTFSSGNIPQVQPVGASTSSGMAAENSGIESLTIKNNWRPSKVKGTDNKEYSAMRDHTSSSDGSDRPTTGTDWDYFWVKTDEDGSGDPSWQPNISYSGDYTNSRIPLNIALSANCWARNIKIDTCGARCIQMYYDNYRFEIRDSTIAKCINRWDSNNCYGTLIGSYSSGILIENNIYESAADGPMLAWGASGNVISYNYIRDAHRLANQRTWFTADGASHHGAHTSFNLWEGNELESAYFDQYWGSHSHNTLFRNRIVGKYMVDGIADESYMQSIQTVTTEKNVHYQNYIGNVLGTSGYHDMYERNCAGCPNAFIDKLIYRTGYVSSGSCSVPDSDPNAFNTMLRHMNYDYVTNSVKYCDDPGEPGCQEGDGSHTLPNSLYLSSKPGWWGNLPWPAIGPDLNPRAGTIPAKQRYEVGGDIAPPAPPTGLKIR